MSDTFFSRWSRRKQAAGQAPTERPATAAEPAPALPVEPPTGEGASAGEPVLPREELAALPSLEEFTAETDITGFLRKGVPEALRKAALRQAWALDPKVRDFVCEAREYAYDWNVPGGVPGAGPLLPTDDPQAMVERLFTKWRSAEDPGDVPAPLVAESSDGESSLGDGEQGEADATAQGPSRCPEPVAEAEPALPPAAAIEPPRLESSVLPLVVEDRETPEPARVRRHGGAMPD